MLRPSNPADLIGLLVLQARSPASLAYGRDALASGGASSVPLSALLGGWIPRRDGRHTWVLSRRGIAVGLVSIHRRKGHGTWEIDRLHVGRQDRRSLMELLEGLTLAAGQVGAERLFLRLASDSPVERAALESGFTPLLREQLYVRPKGPAVTPRDISEGTLRPARPEDDLGLFRLHTAAAPPPVRQAEGMTLGVWRGGSGDLPPGTAPLEAWVLEQNGDLAGAVTVTEAGRSRMVDLLARPREERAAEALVERAVSKQGHKGSLVCLLPEYQGWMGPHLQAAGFQKLGLFNVYVKEVVARAQRIGLLPVGA